MNKEIAVLKDINFQKNRKLVLGRDKRLTFFRSSRWTPGGSKTTASWTTVSSSSSTSAPSHRSPHHLPHHLPRPRCRRLRLLLPCRRHRQRLRQMCRLLRSLRCRHCGRRRHHNHHHHLRFRRQIFVVVFIFIIIVFLDPSQAALSVPPSVPAKR